MNLCVRAKFLKPNLISNLCRFATTTPEVIEQNEQVLIDDTDDAQAREAEIEKKRNKSRLSEAHFNLINGRRPYEEPKNLIHLTVKYSRKMYGKYGIASGVNPRYAGFLTMFSFTAELVIMINTTVYKFRRTMWYRPRIELPPCD